jgi:hypothetical protein
MECLLIGDSIAVGLNPFMPACTQQARGGINSPTYVTRYPDPVFATTVVISLGSNDNPSHRTREALMKLRNRTSATRVYWVLPHRPDDVRATIMQIAAAFGDHIIPFEVSSDGVHPSRKGYQMLADGITLKK